MLIASFSDSEKPGTTIFLLKFWSDQDYQQKVIISAEQHTH